MESASIKVKGLDIIDNTLILDIKPYLPDYDKAEGNKRGNLKKTEVRKLAKKFKLPVAEKKDSQGICFLGAVDLKEFLKHYIKTKKGKVVNKKGEIIIWNISNYIIANNCIGKAQSKNN